MKKLIILLLLGMGTNCYSQFIPPPMTYEEDYWMIPSGINSVKELASILKVNPSLFEMGDLIYLSSPINFPADFMGRGCVAFTYGYVRGENTVSAYGRKSDVIIDTRASYAFMSHIINAKNLNNWSYTLSTNKSWLVLSSYSGNFVSRKTIDLEVKRNYSGSPRSGKVFLHINGQTLELEIKQD